ncbi:nucleoside hydrolase [Hoeflea sp. CAU 1731]
MRHFIIDTDVAADDALAIIMVLQHKDSTVHGITVNCGNIDFDQQVRNALYTLELVGRTDVPVYPGCRMPLQRRFRSVPEVFGSDGFSDAHFPPPKAKPSDKHAVDAIIEAARAMPGELEIIALAPLTNIALALTKAPEIVPFIKSIWFMGATLHAVGNITMGAEYNVWVDPEAADIVMRAGVPLTITPWETAKQDAICSHAEREEIGRMGTPVGSFFHRITETLYSYTQGTEGIDGAIHSDIIGVTVPLFPDEILDQADMYMCVELGGEYSRGVTLLDWVGLAGHEPNVTVIKSIDNRAFRRHIHDMCAAN